VTGLVPLVVLVASPTSRSVERTEGVFVADEMIVNEIGVPADPSVVDLTVQRRAAGNELTWTDSTTRARTFYRVYRSSLSTGFSDIVCQIRGGRRCELRAETLVITRERRYVDPSPPADAMYRIGVAANWLDDEAEGDVFAVSQPVAAQPPAAP
jgi:hypothetical protein